MLYFGTRCFISNFKFASVDFVNFAQLVEKSTNRCSDQCEEMLSAQLIMNKVLGSSALV